MKLKLLAASILVLCTTLPSQAASVRLAWNPSPGRSIVGYSIHYGVKPGKYIYAVKVKGRLTTSVVIKSLKEGETYFFAVTAYNKKGEESALSSEIKRQARWENRKKSESNARSSFAGFTRALTRQNTSNKNITDGACRENTPKPVEG